MKIILKDHIENLGRKGDIVDVASGYGRNYLIPKKLAIEVTPTNLKMIEMEQQALRKGLEREMKTYQDLVQQLNAVSLTFARKAGEKDAIFGSVSATDIRDSLAELNFDIERKKILLDEPIKKLGNYTVPVKVFHDEKAEIKIAVVKEGEPAEVEAEAPAEVEPAVPETAPEEAPETPAEETVGTSAPDVDAAEPETEAPETAGEREKSDSEEQKAPAPPYEADNTPSESASLPPEDKKNE